MHIKKKKIYTIVSSMVNISIHNMLIIYNIHTITSDLKIFEKTQLNPWTKWMKSFFWLGKGVGPA